MAEQKKTTPVKPKKTTAVSESGERRVVLSAKTDPLAFLQEEKQKLAEEIEKAQETDEALKAQLTKKEEPVSSEFTVTKSRKAANREAEQAWDDAKNQMAQWSENSSFDGLRDDPNDDADDEEEGIPISRARRQPISPAQRRNRGYDRTKQILAVCLIFVAMAVSVGGFLFDKLDLVQFDDGVKTEVQPTDTSLLDEAAAITEEELKGLEFTNDYPMLPKGEVFRDPDVVNILLLGTDERTTRFNTNARSDSMILLSIHTRNHTVKLVSFERGTGVPILEGEYKGQYDWLTHCFRYGGANLVMEEIQACYLLDCGHYVRTNIQAFMKLIDVVGGVDIYLSDREADYINHWYNYRYATNHVKEMSIRDELHAVGVGKNHLNGATAMLYARCRALDNDFGRMKRQRIVMQAIFNQIKDLSIPELNNLLNTMLPLIQTNFSRGELATLVLEVPEIISSDFETMQLPESGTFGKMSGMEGRSLFAPDFERNAADLKAFLYG
ncbi:MAG: LCP family protein [Clostridia bacterium]|nr:LCP family protein [Clostridia bacterium]